MKGTFCILLLLLLAIIAPAQRRTVTSEEREQKKQQHQEAQRRDSTRRSQYLRVRLPVVFKFQVASGFALMNNNQSPLKVHSSVGSGAELQLGFKMAKHICLGAGINIMNYFVDNLALQRSVKTLFEQADYTTTVTSYKNVSFTRGNLFFYSSYWSYRPKSVLECYAKLAMTHSGYTIDYLVFSRKNDSHYSELNSLHSQAAFSGMMPSVGANYALRLAPIIYLTLTGEYGYSITNSETLMQINKNSEGGGFYKAMMLPTPAHFVQLNIGMMLRPFNTIRPGEMKYDAETVKRANEKNK